MTPESLLEFRINDARTAPRSRSPEAVDLGRRATWETATQEVPYTRHVEKELPPEFGDGAPLAFTFGANCGSIKTT
jgi:hypothetical protein